MTAAAEIPGPVPGPIAGPLRRVRIWLGDLLVAEYVAERERATRYRRVMAPRFTGLRITVEPLPAEITDPEPAAKLPDEQLWSLTVQ